MHNYTLLDKNNSFILTKKICINLTWDQIQFCNKQFDLSRALWNLYKEYLDKKFKETGKLYNWMDFRYFLNHELLELPEYSYLKDIKKVIKEGILKTLYVRYKMYKDYIFSKNKENKRKVGVPKFKSKKKHELINYYYFEGNQDRVNRHLQLSIRFTQSNTHINLPYLKEVELKEIGYLTEEDLPNIVTSTLTYENHKFYVNLNIRYPNNYFLDKYPRSGIYGIGIDVGIKNYMTIYDGINTINIPNINKSKKIKRLLERIEKIQQGISHRMDIHAEYPDYRCISNNITKLNIKISKLWLKIRNIRNDYMKKMVNKIVRTKPFYITVEKLVVSDLLEKKDEDTRKPYDKNVRKWTAYTGLSYLLSYLKWKCYINGIEVRVADKEFASSKECSNCHEKNKNLELSDRTFHCKNCGLTLDRDVNAAINLYHTTKYDFYTTRESQSVII